MKALPPGSTALGPFSGRSGGARGPTARAAPGYKPPRPIRNIKELAQEVARLVGHDNVTTAVVATVAVAAGLMGVEMATQKSLFPFFKKAAKPSSAAAAQKATADRAAAAAQARLLMP